MDIDFKKEFLSINFDNKLIEANNPLVSSQEHYKLYKQKYIEESIHNFELYTTVVDEYNSLIEKSITKTSSRVVYVYVDKSRVSELRQSLKTIIIKQRSLLDNFNHYIEFLNTNSKAITKTQNTQQTKKGFFKFLK